MFEGLVVIGGEFVFRSGFLFFVLEGFEFTVVYFVVEVFFEVFFDVVFEGV